MRLRCRSARNCHCHVPVTIGSRTMIGSGGRSRHAWRPLPSRSRTRSTSCRRRDRAGRPSRHWWRHLERLAWRKANSLVEMLSILARHAMDRDKDFVIHGWRYAAALQIAEVRATARCRPSPATRRSRWSGNSVPRPARSASAGLPRLGESRLPRSPGKTGRDGQSI